MKMFLKKKTQTLAHVTSDDGASALCGKPIEGKPVEPHMLGCRACFDLLMAEYNRVVEDLNVVVEHNKIAAETLNTIKSAFMDGLERRNALGPRCPSVLMLRWGSAACELPEDHDGDHAQPSSGRVWNTAEAIASREEHE